MAYINPKEASKRLNISLRTIQRRCNNLGFKKGSEGYLIPEETYRKWLLNDKPTTTTATQTTNDTTTAPPVATHEESEYIIQEFTPEEFEYLDKLIKTDHPVLKEKTKQQELRIEELNNNLKLANHRIDILINSMGDQTKSILQRNTLEWIDKSKPKEDPNDI